MLAIGIMTMVVLPACGDDNDEPSSSAGGKGKELTVGESLSSASDQSKPIITVTLKTVEPLRFIVNCKMSGTATHFYIEQGDVVETNAIKRTKEINMNFNFDLEPGTVYPCIAVAEDDQGNRTQVLFRVRTEKMPFVNYIIWEDYKYQQLQLAEMSTLHDYVMRQNSKHLEIKGETGTIAHFFYYVPSYDGITREWEDRTYLNLTNTTSYYTYGVYVWIYNERGNRIAVFEGPGTLTIKSSGNKRIFDYIEKRNVANLYIQKDVVLHFEGTVQ